MSNQTAVLESVVTGGLPVNLASGATHDLSGTTQTIAALADIGGNGGVVTNSASVPATLMINTITTNFCSGAIGGNLALTKSGSGTQTLNGANWFTMPGSAATNQWQFPIDPATHRVFYRLIYP